MKQQKIIVILLWFASILFLPALVCADCASIEMDNGMKLDIPCSEYEGGYYRVIMEGYFNPDDTEGIYFTFSRIENSTAVDSCAVIDANLSIMISCLELQGVRYRLSLEACSCNGAPGGMCWKLLSILPSQERLTGSVQVPAGMLLNPGSLTVVNSLGQARVTDAGEFSLDVVTSKAPQLTTVFSADDTPLFIGWLSGYTPVLSAESTAVALAFQALELFSLPVEDQEKALDLLADHKVDLEPVSKAIAEALKADMAALTRKGTPIPGLLETACQTISKKEEYKRMLSRIAVDPADTKSGITVLDARGVNSVVLMNAYRRSACVHIDQISYVPEGSSSEIAEEVELRKPFWLPSTQGLSGTIGTIIDIWNGNMAYAPIYTDTIELPLRSGASRTTYRIACLGAGGSSGIAPGNLPDNLAKSAEKAATQAFLNDIFIPAVMGFGVPMMGSQDNDYLIGLAELLTMTDYMVKQDSFMIKLFEQHDIVGALHSLFSYAALNGLFQETVCDLIQAKAKKMNLSRLSRLDIKKSIAAGGQIFNAMGVADLIMAGVDVPTAISHAMMSNAVEIWEVVVDRPKVRLIPSESEISTYDQVKLTATVPEATGSTGDPVTFHYTWHNSGMAGTLENSDGSGNTISGDDQWVWYISDKDEDTDLVTVSVKQIRTGVSGTTTMDVGKAEATVTVIEDGVTLSPETVYICPGSEQGLTCNVSQADPDAILTYKWLSPGAHGRLEDPVSSAVNDFESSSNQVIYRSERFNAGEDRVDVEVYDDTTLLGRASCKIFIPKASVTPVGTRLTAGQTVTLTAAVENDEAAADYRFDWNCTSLYGTLVPRGANADYTAGIDENGVDIITVNTVREHNGDACNLISTEAYVQVDSIAGHPAKPAVTLIPGETNLCMTDELQVSGVVSKPPGGSLSYSWSAVTYARKGYGTALFRPLFDLAGNKLDDGYDGSSVKFLADIMQDEYHGWVTLRIDQYDDQGGYIGQASATSQFNVYVCGEEIPATVEVVVREMNGLFSAYTRVGFFWKEVAGARGYLLGIHPNKDKSEYGKGTIHGKNLNRVIETHGKVDDVGPTGKDKAGYILVRTQAGDWKESVPDLSDRVEYYKGIYGSYSAAVQVLY